MHRSDLFPHLCLWLTWLTCFAGWDRLGGVSHLESRRRWNKELSQTPPDFPLWRLQRKTKPSCISTIWWKGIKRGNSCTSLFDRVIQGKNRACRVVISLYFQYFRSLNFSFDEIWSRFLWVRVILELNSCSPLSQLSSYTFISSLPESSFVSVCLSACACPPRCFPDQLSKPDIYILLKQICNGFVCFLWLFFDMLPSYTSHFTEKSTE